MEKEILNVIMGLEILSHMGYEKVTANDGVIFCGSSVDTDEQEEMLTKLGWGWDEDNSEWYILVQKDEAVQQITANDTATPTGKRSQSSEENQTQEIA